MIPPTLWRCQIQKGGRRDADSDFVREGDMKIM